MEGGRENQGGGRSEERRGMRQKTRTRRCSSSTVRSLSSSCSGQEVAKRRSQVEGEFVWFWCQLLIGRRESVSALHSPVMAAGPSLNSPLLCYT